MRSDLFGGNDAFVLRRSTSVPVCDVTAVDQRGTIALLARRQEPAILRLVMAGPMSAPEQVVLKGRGR